MTKQLEVHMSHNRSSALRCPRNIEYAYFKGYEPKQKSSALVLGSAFHAGMQAALQRSVLDPLETDPIGFTIHATAAAHDYIDSNEHLFNEYSKMSAENMRIILSDMFRTYLPEIGLNHRWRVALHDEVLPVKVCPACDGVGHITIMCENCAGKGLAETIDFSYTNEEECYDCKGEGYHFHDCPNHCEDGEFPNNTPMIEFHFDRYIADDVFATGYIDAILVDMQDGNKLVVVDWKTMDTPRNMEECMLDGQLNLYIAVLRHMGATIDTMAMWEFSKKTPRPAQVRKDFKPSISAQKTTWDVWYGSLLPETKAIVDADRTSWEEWADEKLHPMSSFSNYMEAYANDKSSELALANCVAQGQHYRFMHEQYEKGNPLPAIHNGGFGGHCKGCDFRVLCSGVLRYGDDPTTVLENEFQLKEGKQ